MFLTEPERPFGSEPTSRSAFVRASPWSTALKAKAGASPRRISPNRGGETSSASRAGAGFARSKAAKHKPARRFE